MIDPSENWDDRRCTSTNNTAAASTSFERAPVVYDTSESWDCPFSQSQSQHNGGTITMGDPDFQTRLNFKNIFQNCHHSIVRVGCPCPNRQLIHLCVKCHTVFCGQACMDYEIAASHPSNIQVSQRPNHRPASQQPVSRSFTSHPAEFPHRRSNEGMPSQDMPDHAPARQALDYFNPPRNGPSTHNHVSLHQGPQGPQKMVQGGFGNPKYASAIPATPNPNQSSAKAMPPNYQSKQSVGNCSLSPMVTVLSYSSANADTTNHFSTQSHGRPTYSSTQAICPNYGQVLSPNSASSLLGAPPKHLPRLPLPSTGRSPLSPDRVDNGKAYEAQKPVQHPIPATPFVSPLEQRQSNEKSITSAQKNLLPQALLEKSLSRNSSETRSSRIMASSTLPLQLGETYKAACCWAGNPWDLGFNVFQEIEMLESVNGVPVNKSWKILWEPRVGDLCMAPYAGTDFGSDELRYRGKVLHDGSVTIDATILYIDFGNVAQVSKKKLRAMPAELLQIPALARRVKLSNIEPAQQSDWTLQAKMQLESRILDKPCDLVLLSQDEAEVDVFWGRVTYKGEDVGESLLKTGVAQPRLFPQLGSEAGPSRAAPVQRVDAVPKPKQQTSAAPRPESLSYNNLGPASSSSAQKQFSHLPRTLPLHEEIKVVVSYVTHLNDFYVVKEEDVIQRRMLNESLSSAADFTLETYNPAIHRSTVVTINTSKYKWVRGIVEEKGYPTCLVHLLDYGEFLQVPVGELKQPPKHALDPPPFAYHCSMDVIPCEFVLNEERLDGSCWDERIVNKLITLGTPGNQGSKHGLNATCIETSDNMSLIQLRIGGRDCTWGSDLVKLKMATWMYPETNTTTNPTLA